MVRWLYHFKVKDLFSDDESSKEAVRIAKEIVKRLQQNIKIPGQKKHLIDYFNQIKESDADPLSELNEGLDRLYDWANINLVWIE